MKSFSEIRNKLKDYGYLGETHIPSQDADKAEELQEENWGVGVHPYSSADDVDRGNLLDLQDEGTLNQLNAFVGSIANRNYMDPKTAVCNLRNKLQMIGLNFDMDESMIYNGGTVDIPLYRFGTVTGWSKKLDGSFVNGLKTMDEEGENSFVIEMSFEKMFNGLTGIRAQVKRA